MLKQILVLTAFFALASSHSLASVETQIRKDLRKHQGASFSGLMEAWEKKHGPKAVPALIKVSQDKKAEDRHRYVSILAATKMGGKTTWKKWENLLSDRSWLVRLASLRALKVLQAQEAGPAILKRLDDPSLVVRMETVSVIESIRPKGAQEALLKAAEDPKNYQNKKPLWVPEQALKALETMTGKKPKSQTFEARLAEWKKIIR